MLVYTYIQTTYTCIRTLAAWIFSQVCANYIIISIKQIVHECAHPGWQTNYFFHHHNLRVPSAWCKSATTRTTTTVPVLLWNQPVNPPRHRRCRYDLVVTSLLRRCCVVAAFRRVFARVWGFFCTVHIHNGQLHHKRMTRERIKRHLSAACGVCVGKARNQVASDAHLLKS